MPQVARSHFEGLVLFFLNILILLIIGLNILDVFLTIVVSIYTLGGSILRRVVPLFRSNIDYRYVGRDITDIYYFDFLIGAIFNKMALLSVFQVYSVFKTLCLLGVPFIIRPPFPFGTIFLSLDFVQIYNVPSFRDGLLSSFSGGVRFYKGLPLLYLLQASNMVS